MAAAIGAGLPITEPSLGLLIANGYQYLLSGKYWISFFPGLALLLIVPACFGPLAGGGCSFFPTPSTPVNTPTTPPIAPPNTPPTGPAALLPAWAPC